MQTIGLIAAMSQESSALLRLIRHSRQVKVGQYKGVGFQLMDRNCILVTSGIGINQAMDTARILLEVTNVQMLVSFGIAGAVVDDLQIGDVVVASNTCILEKGHTDQFFPLATLSAEAWNAASQALLPFGAHLVSGTAVTTRGSQPVLKGHETLTHPVLEMETAGIAQVASKMGIPLISIRSISDGPKSPIPFNLEAIFDDKYRLRFGKLLMMVLSHPSIIFQSRHMIQNSKKAALNAARVLVSVLNQTLPITIG